jgi:hypothetical protein
MPWRPELQHHAAAYDVAAEEPVAPIGAGCGVAHPHGGHAPDHALGEQSARGHDFVEVPVHPAYLKVGAGLFCGGEDAPASGGGRRHRLLQQDRATGPHRLDRQRFVRVIGRGNDHGRDVRPTDRGGDVVRLVRHPVSCREIASLRQRPAGDHADVRCGHAREATEMVVRDEARPDQGDADAVQFDQILAYPGS